MLDGLVRLGADEGARVSAVADGLPLDKGAGLREGRAGIADIGRLIAVPWAVIEDVGLRTGDSKRFGFAAPKNGNAGASRRVFFNSEAEALILYIGIGGHTGRPVGPALRIR